MHTMGWLRSVGSQKRPMFLGSILIVASHAHYGVATISRLLKIERHFFRISSLYRAILQKRPMFLGSIQTVESHTHYIHGILATLQRTATHTATHTATLCNIHTIYMESQQDRCSAAESKCVCLCAINCVCVYQIKCVCVYAIKFVCSYAIKCVCL